MNQHPLVWRSAALLALAVASVQLGIAAAAPAAPSTNAAAASPPLVVDPVTGIMGATAKKTGDAITGLEIKDPTVLTDADYQKIAQMKGLQSLNFGRGFSAANLKAIAGLPALENLITNGSTLTDADIPMLATFKKLQNLAFFHPTKGFTGATLSSLASLPDLHSFTVGGNTSFSDAGMASVSQIPHMQNFRTWHSGVTIAGVKALANFKELKDVTLGQRLAYTPPTTLSDDAVAVLAGMPSLENINLMEARLSLPALEKLKALPNLKHLTLTDIDIPSADIDTLKKEMPKVAITWAAPTAAMKRINAMFGPSPSAASGAAASAAPSPSPAP